MNVSLSHLGPSAQAQVASKLIEDHQTRSKYGAKRTELDGIWFASKAESQEYARLKQRQMAHEIYGLKLQPEFPVVIGGKTICRYRADFEFYDRPTNKRHILDVKGVRTAVYRLKKKLVEALYSIEIEEVP